MPTMAPVERAGEAAGFEAGDEPGDFVGVKPVVTVCVDDAVAVEVTDGLGSGGGGVGHMPGPTITYSFSPVQNGS